MKIYSDTSAKATLECHFVLFMSTLARGEVINNNYYIHRIVTEVNA